ncbi:hypothetical protein LguiB_005486 [Lonicera macranthoides]
MIMKTRFSEWLELTKHQDFVETMKAERIEPNIQTQASLANNYVSGGLVEKAEAVPKYSPEF